MNQEKIDRLRAAGYSDADINDYIAYTSKSESGPAPVDPNAMPTSDLPEIDVTQKSETLRNAEAAGVPTTNQGSLLTDAAAIGSAVAPYALPAVGIGTGLYGAAKVGGWGREISKGVQSMAEAQRASAAAQQATAQGLQNRFDQRMAQQAAQGARPAPTIGAGAPGTAMPTNPYQVPTANAPIQARPPVTTTAPAPMAPTPAQPSVVQRGAELAAKMREFAAQKVMPAMGQAGQMAGRGLAAVANSPITRVGGMAANALYSGGLNTNEEEELRRRRAMAPTITR